MSSSFPKSEKKEKKEREGGERERKNKERTKRKESVKKKKKKRREINFDYELKAKIFFYQPLRELLWSKRAKEERKERKWGRGGGREKEKEGDKWRGGCAWRGF